MNVLGIMSGTSLDGVDYAICSITEARIRLKELWSARFPSKLKRRLHAAAANQCSSYELAQLHHDLGRFYAAHANGGSGRFKIDLAGLHGQTIFHNPDKRNPATFQLGEPAYLTEALRAPVVSNFRPGDMAAGGQGAPLATLFHKVVFGRSGSHVCVNNIGGISNVTSIDWTRGSAPAVKAFDTGPGNMLMDMAVRELSGGRLQMDKGGAWAGRGAASEKMLAGWLRHPFFRMAPPKSTGRELFGEPFYKKAMAAMKKSGLSRNDMLATLTRFTADSIALNYRQHLSSMPDTVILAGGGASNPVLVDALRESLNRGRNGMKLAEVTTCQQLGWPPQSIEPAAFALLAWMRWNRKPGNLPETTGARRAVLLGQVNRP